MYKPRELWTNHAVHFAQQSPESIHELAVRSMPQLLVRRGTCLKKSVAVAADHRGIYGVYMAYIGHNLYIYIHIYITYIYIYTAYIDMGFIPTYEGLRMVIMLSRFFSRERLSAGFFQ